MKRSNIYATSGKLFIGASLKNIGNTCFLNSSLQCLTHTVPLLEALLSSDHPSSCDIDGFCCLCALKKHVDYCLCATGYSFTPTSFVYNLSKISPDFLPGRQQDAHEFLCCLLDKLDQRFSPIKQIFGGRTKSQVRCCDCGHVTNTYEPFVDLNLEIDHPAICTLVDALESYVKVERLDDPDNKFPCEGCKERVHVEKQIKLVEVPQVIMLSLKRFSFDSDGMYTNGKFVDYPLQLNLEPFVSSSQNGVQYNYELYAVLVHCGSANYGHYYSIVRSMQDVWHVIDDVKVFRISEDMVLHRIAYVLFYVKEGSASWFTSVMEKHRSSLAQKSAAKIARTSSSESVKDTSTE